MSVHEWLLERAADPGDPSGHETHLCRRCGLFRDSEWGALPSFRRQLPRAAGSPRVRYEDLEGDPGCA